MRSTTIPDWPWRDAATSHVAMVRASFLEALRARGALVCTIGVTLLSGALLATRRLHPFGEETVWNLEVFGGFNQVLVLILVVCRFLSCSPLLRHVWWPTPVASVVSARTVGAWFGSTALIAGVVALQYGMAVAAGGAHVHDLVTDSSLPAWPRYLHMLVGASALVFVLHAWGELLFLLLPRPTTLLCLVVLVLSGHVLPLIRGGGSALSLLASLLPNIAALSPLTLASEDRSADLARVTAYACCHAAAVSCASALGAELLSRKGRRD